MDQTGIGREEYGPFAKYGDVVNYGTDFSEYRWGKVRIIANASGAMGGFVWQLGGGRDNATTFSANLIVFTTALDLNDPAHMWWLQHELAHVMQAQQMGAAYLPTYLNWARQFDHAKNPLEIAANSFANGGGTGVIRWD